MTGMVPTAPPAKPVKPPKRRSRLEQLVTQHAAATNQAANRLRNWVSFMVFAGALTRATDENQQPLFWFKGGLTMEARFPGPARATRDLDAIFRLSRRAVDLRRRVSEGGGRRFDSPDRQKTRRVGGRRGRAQKADVRDRSGGTTPPSSR
jgi:hypothetical protein